VHKVRNEKALKRFAKNLKKARTKQGLSQEELAAKCDIAQSSIARIEMAKLNTTISTVFVIIDALGVDANELFE
jgi:predicted transcriptional regulator